MAKNKLTKAVIKPFKSFDNSSSPKNMARNGFVYVLCSFLLALAAIGMIVSIHNGYRVHQIKGEQQQAQAELSKEQKNVNQLKEEAKLLEDEDYVSKLARSRYYLSKDGEIIFSLPEDNDSKRAEAQNRKQLRVQKQDQKESSGGKASS